MLLCCRFRFMDTEIRFNATLPLYTIIQIEFEKKNCDCIKTDCTHSFQRSKRFLQLVVYKMTSSLNYHKRRLYCFSYARLECLQLPNRVTIKVSLLGTDFPWRLLPAEWSEYDGLLIAVHKRSLRRYEAQPNKISFFELNLKWIQIMFFAATPSSYAFFSFSRLATVCARGEKIKIPDCL